MGRISPILKQPTEFNPSTISNSNNHHETMSEEVPSPTLVNQQLPVLHDIANGGDGCNGDSMTTQSTSTLVTQQSDYDRRYMIFNSIMEATTVEAETISSSSELNNDTSTTTIPPPPSSSSTTKENEKQEKSYSEQESSNMNIQHINNTSNVGLNPYVDMLSSTNTHHNNGRRDLDMMRIDYNSSEEFNQLEPIEAFNVPEESSQQPVEAVPVSIDGDNEESSNNSENETNKTIPSLQSRRGRVILIFTTVIVSAILAASIIFGICQSGAGSCRRSSNNSTIDVPNEDDIQRVMNIRTYINRMSFDEETSANSNDLKERAIDWIITVDPLRLSVENDTFRLRQRYSLAALWFHTTVKGSSWLNSSGWLSDDDECDWFGIICTEMDHGEDLGGVHNTVTSLVMTANGMYGIIPTDISFLSNLKTLMFDYNLISGTIPDSIGQCTDLERVELAYNKPLTGTLPESIGNWKELTYFDISNNDFTNQLPISLGNWTNMSFFRISSNRINSTLPSSFGTWSNLKLFDGSINELDGTLPEWIGNWISIESFTILGNRFTGTLPTTVGNWKYLKTLSVHDNQFSGTIPESLGDLDNLTNAHFEANNFTGTMPKGFCSRNGLELIANCWIDCQCCTSCK